MHQTQIYSNYSVVTIGVARQVLLGCMLHDMSSHFKENTMSVKQQRSFHIYCEKLHQSLID